MIHDDKNMYRDLGGKESYSSPGSVAAVINTAKMGTDGLYKTFRVSWKCQRAPVVDIHIAPLVCKDDRHSFQTHFYDKGSKYLEEHRKKYPDGQCLIATAIRSPATWFASMFLENRKDNWAGADEMLQNFRTFLVRDKFTRIDQVLPGLLKDFNAGTLMQQMKIMNDNGGYSLIPAPPTSTLTGCNLLFLRIEDSDRWPEIFQMLDPAFKNVIVNSRAQRNPNQLDQINAIKSYVLTSEEKSKIYNNSGKFIRDWFDVYGYMDDVHVKESM